MREQIDTIPVNEAFDAGDECPFCWLERMSEQKTIRYVLGPGATYMEPEVRGDTDRKGFCREHTKKMYDFGNALGNALIMQTYMAGLIEEFDREAAGFQAPPPKKLFGNKKQPQEEGGLLKKMQARQETCFLCDRLEYHMKRYFHTFFVLLREPEFREKVACSKGFCMRHFARLLELARENLVRVKEDLDHFVSMFDYRSAGKDWKNSRDAVSRSMQKLRGLYPADPPFKMDT